MSTLFRPVPTRRCFPFGALFFASVSRKSASLVRKSRRWLEEEDCLSYLLKSFEEFQKEPRKAKPTLVACLSEPLVSSVHLNFYAALGTSWLQLLPVSKKVDHLT